METGKNTIEELNNFRIDCMYGGRRNITMQEIGLEHTIEIWG